MMTITEPTATITSALSVSLVSMRGTIGVEWTQWRGRVPPLSENARMVTHKPAISCRRKCNAPRVSLGHFVTNQYASV